MFHPIRSIRRQLRTRTRKVIASVAAVGALGGGGSAVSAAVAPDSLPAQFGHQVVRLVTFGVDQVTGTTEAGVR